MDIQSAYKEAGTLRGAAAICGTTHKTVKRILEAAERAETGVEVKRERNFDGVREVVAGKIDSCHGRISAKRLLPLARAAGYEGSPRNFRRLVAEEKAAWEKTNRANHRPVNWAPGDVVAFDWGQVGRLYVFCAVLAWSRVRLVRFSDDPRWPRSSRWRQALSLWAAHPQLNPCYRMTAGSDLADMGHREITPCTSMH